MADALNWALYAATALLALYALRVLMQGKDPEHPGREARLGCGYFFLACLFGGLASREFVGGWGNAARLAVGIFLLAPALGALTRPHGARLVLGVFALVGAVLVAGPVVTEQWERAEEHMHSAPRVELEGAVASLETQREEVGAKVDEWQTRELELRARLGQAGHADFEALSADPEAVQQLSELDRVRKLLDAGRRKLAEIESGLERARAELARLEREGEDGDPEEDLGLTVQDFPPEEFLTPVEEYARQKELQALFEEEFGER